MWRTGLLHRLRDYVVSDQIYGLILSSLVDRLTKIILNRHVSRSLHIIADFTYDYILETALFLICIKEIPDLISSQLSIYAHYSLLKF